MDKYIIIPKNVAKYVKGDRWRLSDQIDDQGPEISKLVSEDMRAEYDKLQESDTSRTMFPIVFQKSKMGVLYYSRSYGYCLVKYPPVNDGTVTMVGYTLANSLDREKMRELQNPAAWTTASESGVKIRDIYSRQDKGKVFGLKSDTMMQDDIASMLLDEPEKAAKLDPAEFDKLDTRHLKTFFYSKNFQRIMNIIGPRIWGRVKNMEIELFAPIFMHLLVHFDDPIGTFKKYFGEENYQKLDGLTLKNIIENLTGQDLVTALNHMGRDLLNRIPADRLEEIIVNKDHSSKFYMKFERQDTAKDIRDGIAVFLDALKRNYNDIEIVEDLYKKYGPDSDWAKLGLQKPKEETE